MIADLVARLDRGWDLCERESDQQRLNELETFWISLLHEYERACDAERCVAEERAVVGLVGVQFRGVLPRPAESAREPMIEGMASIRASMARWLVLRTGSKSCLQTG